jgi:SRSO17 transposase
MRLYLPESWTSDRPRCDAVRVPDTITFAPKWQHALDLLDAALAAGVRRHVVLGDAAFGEVTAFRDALTARGLAYVLRVPHTLVAWPPGTRFVVPTRRGTTGRPRSTPRPTTPTSPLHLAHRHAEGAGPGPEVWLLSEWPRGETAPTKYYLSSLPATTSLRTLVRFGKLRWRIERDYQELKGELGLDHFEGRTWNGFHHHAALCASAHAFLALQRAHFPPATHRVDARRRTSIPASALAHPSSALSAVSAADGHRASTARAVAHVIR